MVRSKKKIRKLENQFILRSTSAFAAASKKAKASGAHTVVSEKGIIYEISPNGSRRELKRVEPPTRVRVGQKVTIW